MSTPAAELHSVPPGAVDRRSSKAGLRAVASFEALKGTIVLVLGITVLAVHKHAWTLTESLLFHLHINLDRRLGSMLMNAATKVTDMRLLTIAAAIVTYCTVRFVEAWGLWNRRVWAEWFALLSGAMYLPLEILKIAERPDWERIGVLAVNVVIIAYMLEIRIRACGSILKCETPEAT